MPFVLIQEQLDSFAKGFFARATELLPAVTEVTFCSYYIQTTKGRFTCVYPLLRMEGGEGGGGGGEGGGELASPRIVANFVELPIIVTTDHDKL